MRSLHDLLTDAGLRSNLPTGTRRNMMVIAGALAAAPLASGLTEVMAQSGRKEKGNKKQAAGQVEADGKTADKRKRRERLVKQDIAVLNYALTLEHLEYAFYRDGIASGLVFPTTRDTQLALRLGQIRDHEEIHVDALTATIRDLGGRPVQEAPCYVFDFGSAQSFLDTAQLLENTGVSAYDGAIKGINSGALQQVGATIATVEARHAAYLNFINEDNPFPDEFDTPLSRSAVLDAAAPFFDCTP